jgi:hypothetical protein
MKLLQYSTFYEKYWIFNSFAYFMKKLWMKNDENLFTLQSGAVHMVKS